VAVEAIREERERQGSPERMGKINRTKGGSRNE